MRWKPESVEEFQDLQGPARRLAALGFQVSYDLSLGVFVVLKDGRRRVIAHEVIEEFIDDQIFGER